MIKAICRDGKNSEGPRVDWRSDLCDSSPAAPLRPEDIQTREKLQYDSESKE